LPGNEFVPGPNADRRFQKKSGIEGAVPGSFGFAIRFYPLTPLCEATSGRSIGQNGPTSTMAKRWVRTWKHMQFGPDHERSAAATQPSSAISCLGFFHSSITWLGAAKNLDYSGYGQRVAFRDLQHAFAARGS